MHADAHTHRDAHGYMHIHTYTHFHTHIHIFTQSDTSIYTQTYNKPIYTYVMNPYMHIYNTYT